MIITALTSGCEQTALFIDKFLFPERDHVIILEPDEFSMDAGEYTFIESMPPIVREDSNSLCFVLAENQDLDSKSLDEVTKLINDSGLTGSVLLNDGSTFSFERPSSVWSLEGKILERKERSACLELKCNEKMEAGKRIQKISFSTSSPIKAKGLYWIGTDPL